MSIQQIKEIQSTVEIFQSSLFKLERMYVSNTDNTQTIDDVYLQGQKLLNILSDYLPLSKCASRKVYERQLTKLICDTFNTNFDELLSNRQNRENIYLLPRQIHMTCLNVYFGYSLSKAGEVYGKDHATVVHSKKAIFNFLEIESDFRRKYGHIFEFCKSIKL